jgi:hypothetical protein
MRLFIEPREWRWVILISCGLALLSISTFFWVSYRTITSEQDIFFVGGLHDYPNSAGDLTRVYQGATGRWMSLYLHTPEADNGTLINLIYVVVGQLSRLFSLPAVAVYHIVRVCAGVFMYLAIYQLAASIWTKVRTRRIFFLMVSLGSGLGWFFNLLGVDAAYLDLNQPSVFPFFSTLASIHIPLTIACLALLASVTITVMRPDETDMPTVSNGGTLMFMVGLILAILYPFALLPISLAFSLNIVLSWTTDKRVNNAQSAWLLWFLAPPLPILLYYFMVFQSDSLISAIWIQEFTSPPPSFPVFLMSFGLPLVIALPGLYRAVRHFERDGNQFMLLWLSIIMILIYLPTAIQLNFAVGLIIPMMYFATRAIEDFWRRVIPKPLWQGIVYSALIILFISNLIVLFAPLKNVDDMGESPIFLPIDYKHVFEWLQGQHEGQAVVLASPEVSLWLPSLTGMRAVYGHPTQTAQPIQKLEAVQAWYRAEACNFDLLNGQVHLEGSPSYLVRYVIDGPLERRIGTSACLDSLTLVVQFGDVRIYRYDG